MNKWMSNILKTAAVLMGMLSAEPCFLGAETGAFVETVKEKSVPASVEVILSMTVAAELGFEPGVGFQAKVQHPDGTVDAIAVSSPINPMPAVNDGDSKTIVVEFSFNTNGLAGLYTVGLEFTFPDDFSGEPVITGGSVSIEHPGALRPGFTRGLAQSDSDPTNGPVWYLPFEIR